MFSKFRKGDRLVVQLNNREVLYGEYVKSTENRLDLKKICDQDGREIGGIMSFYVNQVISVRLLCKRKEEPMTSCSDLAQTEIQSDVDRVLLDEEEFDRLKQVVQDHIFIHQKDNTYHEACAVLNSAESIGLVGLGCSSGRDSRVSLLVLSTWQTVYIFDVSECPSKSFHKELKEILESPYIQKALHDGRALVDSLFHSHGVKINNTFDTLIADVSLRKRENKFDGKLRNISECLIDHLNFPEYLLYGAVNVSDNEWTIRPVEHEIKIKAALLGAYLLTLKDCLLSKLLKDYFESVNSVYRMTTKADSFGLNKLINRTELTPELDALIK